MKTISFFASLAVLLAAGSAAYGQITVYGTNFDGSTTYPYTDSTGYTDSTVSNADLVGQGSAGTGGPWIGNDDPSNPETGSSTVYTGGLNQVLTSGATNPVGSGLYGQLEGQASGSGITVLPGRTFVSVAHAVTLNATAKNNIVSLTTDFDISSSGNSFTSGYGFAFQGASFTNLLAIQFIRDPSATNNANGNTQDIVQYQIGTATAVASTTNAAVLLNRNYRLTIAVNMRNNTFSATLGGVNIFTNISLGTTLATSTTQIAALQFESTAVTTDANGGITNSGSDSLSFDNFALTVPEPSTYAALVVGGLGLAGVMRFRRRQA